MSVSSRSSPPSMTLGADAETMLDAQDDGPSEAGPAVGTQLGRYVVVDAIGEGGMGRVLRAYDAKLRREVALKLLRSSGNAEGRARIVREAQAMAQLTHPNVVAVYDVETHEGQPFIAMEYVEGRTLRAWLSEEPRTWRQILEVFRAAGAGLSAAHRAGLVHRDFKPANVLIETDHASGRERVRVTDFGLARGVEHLSSNSPAAPLDSGGDTLTIAGTVMGTPAYMAPEQHAGRDVDARSDQYAFCVALWEALCGKRPFVGPDLALLKASPERLEFPTDRTIPRFVRRVLRRGLSVDPAERYVSMDALLEDLSRTPTQTRTRLLYGAVAAGLLSWIGVQETIESAARSECETLGQEISAVWDPGVREEIEQRFLATGSPLAEQTIARVTPRLDQHASRWAELRTQSCIGAEIEGDDRVTYRLATECLDERRAELEGAIEAFRGAEANTLAFAVTTAADLSPLQSCLDPKWLHSRVSLPEDEQTRAAVFSLRNELAAIDSLIRAGRYTAAEVAMPSVTRRVEELGFAPLLARTRVLQGDLADLEGDSKRARELHEEAFYIAGRAGADDLAASTAITLTFLSTFDGIDHQIGLMWAGLAQMLLDRMGDTDRLQAARLENNRAVLLHDMKRYDEALAGHQRSLELRRSVFGTDDPGIATSYNNIGNIHYDRKDLDAARQSYERCIEIRERLLGTQHPKGALPLRNVGELEYDARAYEDALMYLEDALAIYVDVWGEDHMFVSNMLTRIGRIYYARGQFDTALAHHERALEIALTNRGPDAPIVADLLNNVGQTYARLGLHVEALPRYERALQIDLAQEDPTDYSIAFTTMLIGANLLDRGQPGPALEQLERALSLATSGDASSGTIASVQFAMARAAWFDPDQRPRALQLAQEAIANYERGGPWNDIWKAEVEAWLTERRG